jgi:hypothetical protein
LIQGEIQEIRREILSSFWRDTKGIMRMYKKCTLHCGILSKNKYTLYKGTEGVYVRLMSKF